MSNGEPNYSHFNPAVLRSGVSLIAKVHCENQDLPIVDRLIEPQTIANFLSFCVQGVLPNGKRTALGRLEPEELQVLGTSPEANNDDGPIIERIMERIGSVSDGDRLCQVGKNIASVKTRAWAGIAPLSEQRWKEKRLDDPDNFDIAAQYLSSVIAGFEYLNQPRVAKNMRDTFNLIWAHFEEFERMVNASWGREQRPISITRMWTEYMTAHFEVMTERAHRWVIVHVNALRAPLMQALASHRPVNVGVVDSIQWKITDRLHVLAELAGVADYAIMIPMSGYKGYMAPPIPSGIPPALRSPEWNERQRAYGPRLKQVTHAAQYQDFMERRMNGGSFSHRHGGPESLANTCQIQIDSQYQVRCEIRGDPIEPVPKEPWIAHNVRQLESGESITKGYGLIIYRLTYQQSDAEWAVFLRKLEDHMSDWGSGQTGSGALKPHLNLHWRDGKALSIPEGDIEAAKKHYLENSSEGDLPFKSQGHINDRVFLAVDAPSYASYTGSSYAAATDLVFPGDFTGFVLAVDAEYDPEEGWERPEESPGYPGQMRILGSLIWGDLYGMMSSQCAILGDLWALALDHPNNVYVGPTVPLQVHAWRIQNGIRGVLMREMAEYVQAQIQGRPWPTKRTESRSVPAPQPTVRSSTSSGPAQIDTSDLSGDGTEPIDAAIRQLLLGNFASWLRQTNRSREAVFVEELQRTAPGELPDMQRITDLLEQEEENEEDDVEGSEGRSGRR